MGWMTLCLWKKGTVGSGNQPCSDLSHHASLLAEAWVQTCVNQAWILPATQWF